MRVSGNKGCDTCGWADISNKSPRVTVLGEITLIQNGTRNIICTNTGQMTINYCDGEMECSGWKPWCMRE